MATEVDASDGSLEDIPPRIIEELCGDAVSVTLDAASASSAATMYSGRSRVRVDLGGGSGAWRPACPRRAIVDFSLRGGNYVAFGCAAAGAELAAGCMDSDASVFLGNRPCAYDRGSLVHGGRAHTRATGGGGGGGDVTGTVRITNGAAGAVGVLEATWGGAVPGAPMALAPGVRAAPVFFLSLMASVSLTITRVRVSRGAARHAPAATAARRPHAASSRALNCSLRRACCRSRPSRPGSLRHARAHADGPRAREPSHRCRLRDGSGSGLGGCSRLQHAAVR